MRHAALLPLLLAIGCSSSEATPQPPRAIAPPKPSPKYPRLEPGTAGMVSGTAVVMIQHPDGRHWEKGEPEFVDCFVLEGDRLLVLADDRDGDDRSVRVRMESGESIGRPYLIERRYIRSLSTPRP